MRDKGSLQYTFEGWKEGAADVADIMIFRMILYASLS